MSEMRPVAEGDKRRRMIAAVAALGVQGVIAFALINGLNFTMPQAAQSALEAFNLASPPKPEPPPPPADGGASAPEGKSAKLPPVPDPAPHVAPSPAVSLPADQPATPPNGRMASADGSGAGTFGSGSGGGGSGDGFGSGTGGGHARRIAGALSDRDYPAAAGRAGAQGVVYIRFTVDPSGRVSDCSVTRSSGYAMLDQLTCRLVQQRFRYRPATRGDGTPVAEVQSTSFTWGMR